MELMWSRVIVVIYLCLHRTGGQCLEQLSPTPMICSFDYNHAGTERAEKDLNQCFDDCIGTSSGEDCKTVEWNPKEGTCIVHTMTLTSTSSGDCLVFTKVPCPDFTDHRCQKKVSNAVFSKTIPITYVNDMKTCGTICTTMGLKCKGYEWVESTSTCKWASGELNQLQKPGQGHIIINLDNSACEKRCYLLRNNGLTRHGVQRPGILDLKGCLDLMRYERKARIDWDGSDGTCWVHDILQGKVEYIKFPLHQFQNFCQDKEFKKVCLQKHPGQRMQRGLVLRHVTKEADCVDICSNTRNCVAVDWSVQEAMCYFHHFRVNIVDGNTFNHYVPVSSCEVEAKHNNTWNMRDTSLLSGSRKGHIHNHFVKSLSFKGDFEKTKDWVILLPSMIRCAAHCPTTPHCEGFTFVLHTRWCYLGFHGNKFEYIRRN